MLSDPTAENRKKDHIELAFESQADSNSIDGRFYYEPLLSAHPTSTTLPVTFLNHELDLPLWISSMTGGTKQAGHINRNLARACHEFRIGMGLGSCRSLLDSDLHFADFDLRGIIGPELPFFANLGIAQVESLLRDKATGKIDELIGRLNATGLIIHVNPLQEWLQPEGDRLKKPALETISEYINLASSPVIVKEVGQGMGPQSLRELLQLPLAAVDFGAFGGTNFSRLETMRSGRNTETAISYIGHTAEEMVQFVNEAVEDLGEKVKCREIIISGGIKNYLDGYYFISKIRMNAIYAQGSAFLKYAQNDYESLKNYIKSQAQGLILANRFLTLKPAK